MPIVEILFIVVQLLFYQNLILFLKTFSLRMTPEKHVILHKKLFLIFDIELLLYVDI